MEKRESAFTLVELLVVISIIALLLAILMPALSKAREQARKVICASNEKAILLAMTTYAVDNEDWYPVGGTGMYSGVDDGLLEANYLKCREMFYCRSDRDFGTIDPPISAGDGGSINYRSKDNARSYSFSVNPYGWSSEPEKGSVGWRKVTEIKRTTQTILIVEEHHLWNILYENPFQGYYGPLPPNSKTTNGLRSGYSKYPGADLYMWSKSGKFAHREGLNFGFADCHVEYIKVDIENEYPPFWWYDNGQYRYNRWPP